MAILRCVIRRSVNATLVSIVNADTVILLLLFQTFLNKMLTVLFQCSCNTNLVNFLTARSGWKMLFNITDANKLCTYDSLHLSRLLVSQLLCSCVIEKHFLNGPFLASSFLFSCLFNRTSNFYSNLVVGTYCSIAWSYSQRVSMFNCERLEFK